MSAKKQLFEILGRQAEIVEQMSHDQRLPETLRPVVEELAHASHDFGVQRRCLNALKDFLGDLVSAYASTIIEADVWGMAMDHGF